MADKFTDAIAQLPGVSPTTPVVDATACVGGNALSFAKRFQRVVAIATWLRVRVRLRVSPSPTPDLTPTPTPTPNPTPNLTPNPTPNPNLTPKPTRDPYLPSS